MDPHSAAAFYRMKLFLADLNHVLGAVIPLKDRPTFNYANSKNSSSGCRTTQRSRAWKRSRLPRMKPQIEGFKSQHTPRTCVVRLPLCTRPIESTYKEDQPEYDTQNVGRSESQFRQAPHCPHASEPEQQYLEGPHSNEPDQQYFEGDGCFERYTDGFNDVNNSLEDSAANDDFVPDYHNNPYENHDNATVGDVINPEFSSDPVPESSDDNLQEAGPEIVQPDQQEPEFDMANYSATDVNRWARTLLAKDFVFLQLRGSAAQNESFKQQLFTPPQQPERRSVTFNNQDEYINYEPDNTNHPNLHPFETGDAPDHTSDSNFYNGSDGGDGLDHNGEADVEDLHHNNLLNGNFDGNGHSSDVYDGDGGGVCENHDDRGGYNDCDDGGGYGNCDDEGAYGDGEDGGGYGHFDNGGGYEHFDDGGGSEDFDDGAGYNDLDDGAGYEDFDEGGYGPNYH
ncbi:hypothetical protein PSHT_11884 [Puccinia striiformis]|uniref:Uncharacterized protein n=1 Tax=Puccinia striiformis TaxID=27350 RepID=A0A2S4V0A7_9BASI|nr:hypothetical protein PSHT_11884 [Puccinia striiformis]